MVSIRRPRSRPHRHPHLKVGKQAGDDILMHMKRNVAGILMILTLLLVAAPALAQDFNLGDVNPISGVNDLDDVVNNVAKGLLGVAIPIAVLMYIYAGVLYITAGAKPQNVQKAKNVLLYTSIGLAIILIGGGFVDLIISILNLGS